MRFSIHLSFPASNRRFDDYDGTMEPPANEGPVSPPHQNGSLRRAAAFVLLTFGLALAAYLPVIASANGLLAIDVPGVLAALGVFSPAIAALLLRVHDEGRAGVRRFVATTTTLPTPTRWWVAIVLGPPFLLGASYAGYLLLGGEFRLASTVSQFTNGANPAIVLPLLVVATLVLSYGEEAGWRGYLLPLLQTRWSALGASLVLGVVWFCWHVPLLFLPGDTNGGFPLALWATSIVASSIVYTWLFNGTGGSVIAVTVFHAGLNVWGRLVLLHPNVTGDWLSAVAMTGGNVLVALALLVVFGGARLARPTPVETDQFDASGG